MSTIDERIVSIKFNNSQFEAGIKTTMSSLDGLKKTLNFTAGISALGDLDAAGKKVTGPKLDTTGFNASVKSTIDASNNLKQNLKFDGVTKGLNDLDAAGKKVNLKLDAAGFQAGAKAVVDAANTIKANLNFESAQRGFGNFKSSVQSMSFQSVVSGAQSAARSLGELDLAGKAVNFLPISDGAERAKSSISLMSVAGIAAIASLAVKAASAGAEMAKSLFIDPAKSGLAEYELNLGSIQTIMANTQSKGSTLTDVNGALDELNNYSDKTIYNFAEMAKNIGTFTSAGVGLKDSTTAIKGIANLAALSGSNSEQASTAMYQLSQAMSTGSVKLQDWNSVVNAGMGGEVFQNALKQTAENQGTNVDALIAKHGSFRDSLTSGWVTDKVMLETLSKMTGDLTDEQLRAMGYNDEQIKGIQEMAVTASDAATKIKTFSQLTGTLTEITGSGWAQSWKYILGDFEQAKVMWTRIYGVIGGMVQGTADARNKMLREWNESGGRQEMIWAVENAFHGLLGVLKPIKDAFREVFPPTTGAQLFEITKAIRIFTEALLPSEATVGLLKNTFKLLFTIIKIGVDIIKGAFSVVFAFFKAFATGGESVAGSVKPLTDFLGTLADKIAASTFVKDFFTNLAKAATILGTALGTAVRFVLNFAAIIGTHFGPMIGEAIGFVGRFVDMMTQGVLKAFFDAGQGMQDFSSLVLAAVSGFLEGGFDAAMTRVRERLESLGRLGDTIARAWDAVSDVVSRAWEKIRPLREAIAKMFEDIKNEIKNALTDVNFDDSLDMVNTGLLVGLVVLFKKFFKKLTGMGDGMKDGLMKHISTTFEGINGTLEQLTSTLGAMQQNLQADTLLKIAIAIGILAISVVVLSMIDSGKLTKALIAIGVMVVILGKAMGMLDKISVGSGYLKIPFIAASMILLAVALTILTIPVLILSRLSWGELIKGLLGVSVMLYVLSKATESMAKNPADLVKTGLGLIAIAIAVKILADAVSILGKLGWKELVKGLGSVSIVLFALTKSVESMAKNPADLIATGVGLIAVAIAVKVLASAVSDFGKMPVKEIIKGIIAIGIILIILENFSSGVADVKGMIQTAIGIVILALAMKVMATAVKDFAAMDWDTLGRGLTGMVIALMAVATAMDMMPDPKNMLANAVGMIAVGLSLKIIASALLDMGKMSWEEIAKGLVTLAGSLLILSVAMILMEGTVSGAAAMLIASVALLFLATALVQLGNMSWEQIGMGMAALAASFIVFGLAGLILAPIVPVLLLLGIAIGLLGLGLMGMGIGVAMFAAGLFLISTVLIATGPAMILFIGSILALIPLAMAEFGKGIVAFAEVIGNAMPIFLVAFVKLLLMLLTAIDIVAPNIMDTLWNLIVLLVDLVVRGIPLFVDAGMKIIIGILTGIGNNIGQMVDAGSKLVVEYINGISRNMKSITDAGANLILTFIESLASSVRENQQRMADAGADLAGAIIDGMANGVATMAGRVLGAIGRVANDALAEVAKIFDSHSPSKEFALLGGYASWGMAVGIEAKGKMVTKAMGAVAYSALDTLKETMAKIDTTFGNSMDLSPTIKPVLDLSAIKRDSGLVSGMLKAPTLDLNSSYSKAAMLSAQARANLEQSKATATETVQATSGPDITLIQNNHSPKALSAADIYRQTKNQISIAKGVLSR